MVITASSKKRTRRGLDWQTRFLPLLCEYFFCIIVFIVIPLSITVFLPERCFCLKESRFETIVTIYNPTKEEIVEAFKANHVELCEWSLFGTRYFSSCRLKKEESLPFLTKASSVLSFEHQNRNGFIDINEVQYYTNQTESHNREWYKLQCRLFHSYIPRLFIN